MSENLKSKPKETRKCKCGLEMKQIDYQPTYDKYYICPRGHTDFSESKPLSDYESAKRWNRLNQKQVLEHITFQGGLR